MPLGLGISQPEQYTHTIVLLGLGALLFYQSLARRSAMIRKAGLVVIGLAVAKVFLVDVTDLDGLTRVFSLLGLALAALAWLNRWAQERDCKDAARRRLCQSKTRLPPMRGEPISHPNMTAFLPIIRITSPALSNA